MSHLVFVESTRSGFGALECARAAGHRVSLITDRRFDDVFYTLAELARLHTNADAVVVVENTQNPAQVEAGLRQARQLIPIDSYSADTPPSLQRRGSLQLQGVSGLAIVFGAIAVPLLMGFVRRPRFAGAVFAAACVALMSTAYVQSPTGLFAAYFAFMFLFELTLTVGEAQMIQAARLEDIATLSVASGSAGTALLVITALLTGALVDTMPFDWDCALVATAALAMALGLRWLRRSGPAIAHTSGVVREVL
jgi:hypothetical protein